MNIKYEILDAILLALVFLLAVFISDVYSVTHLTAVFLGGYAMIIQLFLSDLLKQYFKVNK